MKRIITLIAIAGALAVAGPAAAAPIRECGNFVPTAPWHWNSGYWTYRTVLGYTPVYNLTTRNVSCSDARPFSLYVMKHAPRYGSHRGTLVIHYACTFRWFNGEDWDVRCTGNFSPGVVHWQGGA